MSVLDKFLNVMKLNDDEDFEEEKYFDEEADDLDIDDGNPRRRIVRDRDEDELFDGETPPVKPSRTKSAGKEEGTSSSVSKFRTSRKKDTSSSGVVGRIVPSRPRRRGDGQGMEVCVIRPHSMEDAREITETLLAECTVVLNVEGLELELAQRIIDFSSGSCFAIDGNLQKISNYIFIITPASVDISGDFQEILSGAFDVPFESRY